MISLKMLVKIARAAPELVLSYLWLANRAGELGVLRQKLDKIGPPENRDSSPELLALVQLGAFPAADEPASRGRIPRPPLKAAFPPSKLARNPRTDSTDRLKSFG